MKKILFVLIAVSSTLFAQIPAPPQNLTAIVGSGQIKLKWNQNTEVDFLKYLIYMGTDPVTMSLKDSTTALISATTITINQLTYNRTYYFRVSAIDSARLESARSLAAAASSRANPRDVYLMIDTSFNLQQIGFNAIGVPAGIVDDSVIARAYKAGVAFFGNSASTYSSGTITYAQFTLILQGLFFAPQRQVLMPPTILDLSTLKAMLLSKFDINIDSVEAANRGIASYVTVESDLVTRDMLAAFAKQAVKYLLFWEPYQEIVAGDTTNVSLNVFEGQNFALSAFRTIFECGELTNGITLSFNPATGFSGNVTSQIVSYSLPPYTNTFFSIVGLNETFINQPSYSLGTLQIFDPRTGQHSYAQDATLIAETSAIADVCAWGLPAWLSVYDRADANRDWKITIVDAVLVKNWLLYSIVPPVLHLGDGNGNNILDVSDPWEIAQQAAFNNTGIPGLGKVTRTMDAIASGLIYVNEQISDDSVVVTVAFEGDAGSAHGFGGSFAYNATAFSFVKAKLNDAGYGISGFSNIGNKVNVLSYPESFSGKFASLTFKRLKKGEDLSLALNPLAAGSFMTLGEKIKVDIASFTTSAKLPDVMPSSFQLFQNYPNPFNPSTTIRYALPQRSRVRLQIFNMLGQVVAELGNSEQSTGYQSAVWNANVTSGMYLCRIEAVDISNPNNRFVDTKKLILLK